MRYSNKEVDFVDEEAKNLEYLQQFRENIIETKYGYVKKPQDE